jgi:hypothetical protein
MDQGQFEAKLAETETRLRRLRLLYDQWFHGLERAEPQTQRLEVDRLIAELRRQQIRNTALKFRLNQLVQRYLTYNTYWQRITRQIEEGTYKRDVMRARKRFGQARPGDSAPPNRPDGYELDLEIDVEAAIEAAAKSDPPASDLLTARHSSSAPPPGAADSERPPRALREITPFALPSIEPGAAASAFGAAPLRQPSGPVQVPPIVPSAAGALGAALRQPSGPVQPPPPPAGVQASARANAARPAAPPNARKPPPAPGRAAVPASNGLSDEQILDLYQRYVSARRDNKERTDNVRIETVAKTVRDMMPKLKEKHAGKQIDFEVVVKDGRVALKPVPK